MLKMCSQNWEIAMRNKLSLILILLLLGINAAGIYAQSEQVSITTYYPSPYGIYEEMIVSGRQAIGDVNNDGSVDAGDLPVDGSGNPLDDSLVVAGSVGIGTNRPIRKLHVNSTLAADIARFEGHSDSPAFLDITNVDAGGIRLSTDATGPFRIRTENIIGGDQFIVDTNANVAIGPNLPTSAPSPGNNQAKENLDVNDVWLRAANGGTGRWASAVGGAGSDCYWTGAYDDSSQGDCGNESCRTASTCDAGYTMAGIKFENSPGSNASLDNWWLYCCR